MTKTISGLVTQSRGVVLMLLAGATLAGLSACAPVIIGGAALGVMSATDRRTSGTQLEDEGIELRAASRIREALGERGHVNVTSYNRQVLLTGEVASEQDKQHVADIAQKVDNVRSTVNELVVMGVSTLGQRSSDAVVTGRVKAALLDDRDLHVNAFKVVTERGTTYLMGRVSQREADIATQVTRSTTGVQKVVRLLELISEEEVKRFVPATPSADSRK